MRTLDEPQLRAVLDRLHAAAAGDDARWAERRRRQAGAPRAGPDPLVRMGEMYIAVSPAEGALLYFLARASRASTLVEFGASYGISTLYLAAAARDGDAHLFTTEVHPEKCRATRAVLVEAGLDDRVTLLEGDARETLATLDGSVGFVFLDGWKSLYLPVLEVLRPRLAPGATLVADNVDFEAAQDYVDQVSAADSAFFTHRFGDLALSVLDADLPG
ncbi:MAG: O-methyltransferase [Gammaproteobacteria bacterium]